jgi:Protein of unknown function (DUF669)
MAFFKQDNKRAQENANSFAPLPEGDYEVFATVGKYEAEPGKTPNINLQFTVRSDVEQEGKGRKVFHRFWISQVMTPREGQTKSPYEWCMQNIEEFGMHVGIPDGAEFPDEAAWVNYILGKPVKARLKITEYDGKERNEIAWFNKSDYPNMKEQVSKGVAEGTSVPPAGKAPVDHEDPFANDGTPIDISDDDLPF